MRASILLVLLFVATSWAVSSSSTASSLIPFTVIEKNGNYEIIEGKHGLAFGYFDYCQKENGWNTLDIISNYKQDNEVQAFAGGFLEGGLTQTIIYQAFQTFWNLTFGPEGCPEGVQTFVLANDAWVRKQAKLHVAKGDLSEDDTQYWNQVNLVTQQFDGLLQGYNQHAPANQQLSYLEFLLYQLQNEISDIEAAINLVQVSMDPVQNMLKSHCSSLVKLTPDGNLFSSHVTWYSFSSMLRVYKTYDFTFDLTSSKSYLSIFSSYPGFIPSGDDWLITDQYLTVAETTNSVMNQSLYEFTTTETVPYWIRSTVAVRMSVTGEDWVQNFAKYNSGTYNNQWIVVDYKLHKKGEPLIDGVLWIAEQIPGYVISADKTDVLNATSYWGSYNIPYFPFVYNISGYPEAAKQAGGNSFSYSMCPRAQIFRRDHHKVVDMESMKRMMRYNQWQTDPLSLGDACNSISARCDLDPPGNGMPQAFGGLDCKISDTENVLSMNTKAVSGPTWDSQPVFAWTEQWSQDPSYGEVKVYDFDFVDMLPKIV